MTAWKVESLRKRRLERRGPMMMMTQPVFEVRGEWKLTMLPPQPSPWMVQGRAYAVVLRRQSGQTLPEAEVCDVDSGAVLARYSWRHARNLFTGHALDSL